MFRSGGQTVVRRRNTDEESDSRDYLIVGQGVLSMMHAGLRRLNPPTHIQQRHCPLDSVEAYDLAEDPHETTNLARECPNVTRKGLALLD